MFFFCFYNNIDDILRNGEMQISVYEWKWQLFFLQILSRNFLFKKTTDILFFHVCILVVMDANVFNFIISLDTFASYLSHLRCKITKIGFYCILWNKFKIHLTYFHFEWLRYILIELILISFMQFFQCRQEKYWVLFVVYKNENCKMYWIIIIIDWDAGKI